MAYQESAELIPLENWPRRDHFLFFREFLEPFFSVTAQVECTGLVLSAQKQAVSPTLRLWHGVLCAANDVEAFRLRIRDGAPVRYPVVHLSPTVLRADETFAISFVSYHKNYDLFAREAKVQIDEAKASRGLLLDLKNRPDDLIHFSTLPWFRFTALTHARPLKTPDSEPKVSIGRFAQEGERYLIPVSITVHHALMDGLHVGRFLEKLEHYYQQIW